MPVREPLIGPSGNTGNVSSSEQSFVSTRLLEKKPTRFNNSENTDLTEDNSDATSLDDETLPTNFKTAGRVTSPSSKTKPSVHSSSELAVTPTLSQTGGEGGKPARTPLEITTEALDISTTDHKPKIIDLTHKDNDILCALGMNKKKTTMTETIKLIAWNCNGIQSLVKKGHLRELLLKHRPTVLALSEIKISLKKLRKFRGLTLLLRACGYHFSYWHPQSRGHGGLHGTAIISRLKPTTVRCGWIHSREPDLDGRVITAVYDGFTIVQTYVPCTTWPERKIPAEKARQQNDRRRLFDVTLRRHLKAVRIEYKQPVFWTGDQNVAITPEDVWDGTTNPRRCEYPGSKPWEREACQQTLDAMGFVDAYRRLHNPVRMTSHNSKTIWIGPEDTDKESIMSSAKNDVWTGLKILYR